jgi:RNA polymerase sigma-B factor
VNDQAPGGPERRTRVGEHQDADRRLRARLVEDHLDLARALARRFANRGIPQEDLDQVASFGLLQAAERFDPDRGVDFAAFASPTILGELKRHFRDRGWAIRVPRRIQELHLRLNALVSELTHTLGRSPTIAELATAARASEEEVIEAMEAALVYRAEPFDADGVATTPRDELATEDLRLFHAENRVMLESLIAELGARDRLLIQLRFYDDMTQAEIADRLGISQMHVSRLLARCLEELRRRARTAGG